MLPYNALANIWALTKITAEWVLSNFVTFSCKHKINPNLLVPSLLEYRYLLFVKFFRSTHLIVHCIQMDSCIPVSKLCWSLNSLYFLPTDVWPQPARTATCGFGTWRWASACGAWARTRRAWAACAGAARGSSTPPARTGPSRSGGPRTARSAGRSRWSGMLRSWAYCTETALHILCFFHQCSEPLFESIKDFCITILMDRKVRYGTVGTIPTYVAKEYKL